MRSSGGRRQRAEVRKVGAPAAACKRPPRPTFNYVLEAISIRSLRPIFTFFSCNLKEFLGGLLKPYFPC